jgi:hypothetical protein
MSVLFEQAIQFEPVDADFVYPMRGLSLWLNNMPDMFRIDRLIALS